MFTNSEKIVLLQRDLARMTRRHRDALCKLRHLRAELLVQRAMRHAAYDAMQHARNKCCTRRCPIRKRARPLDPDTTPL